MDIRNGVGSNSCIEFVEEVCICATCMTLEKVMVWLENGDQKYKRCEITADTHVGAEYMLYLQDSMLWKYARV